jgi:hypothetical protein
MQQTLVNLQGQLQVALPPRDRLEDFQRTKPPTFSYAMDPMDADDWLKSVEKKLKVVLCNNYEMVFLASHQLQVLQPTGGMLMWRPMRNLRASTSRSSEPLSVLIMFPRE